jgi:hypothetical protein
MRRGWDIGIEGETMTNQTAAAAKATASTMMRYDANKKSMVVSYLLWFFLGMLGAHRFFLGQKHSAVASSRFSSSGWRPPSSASD